VLSVAAPWWLAGLLLVPLIRWWHRSGRHRRVVRVSRLSLWHGAATRASAAAKRHPPDPAWRRRALFAALLCFALAGPEATQQRQKITLWIDDSASMLTREAEGTRLELGVARALSLLAETAPADIEVRALATPWRSLGEPDAALVRSLAAGAGRRPTSAPPPGLLASDRLHWLVTDGADGALLRWPGDRRPDRIIQVAGVTRNVGLRRMSARRSADDPGRFDLLIEMMNGGNATETRQLIVTADSAELDRSTHRLDPGASKHVIVRSPTAATATATLQPGDALAEDDRLQLDLAALRRRPVAVDPACAAPLVAAITAHPALRRVDLDDASAEAVLSCGTRSTTGNLPTLQVVAEQMPFRPTGSPLWASTLDRSRRVALDAESLGMAARLSPGAADVVLLAIGTDALIVRRAGAAPRIETSLDFDATRAADRMALPLLVNLMFELLLGDRLLDTTVDLDRGPGAARVAPDPGVAADAHPDAKTPADSTGFMRGQDWTRPLLMIAALVLLWEILALFRQARRRAI
jgi:hypothetical protein